LDRCLPDSIEDEDEMPWMGDVAEHSNMLQHLDLAGRDRVTPEQRFV
jgi:hypothetical protein